MPVDLLELAVRDPHGLGTELIGLDDGRRQALLAKAGLGSVSRKLFAAFEQLGPPDDASLVRGNEITVYFARTSFPALGAFELHLFRRDGRGPIWGRTVNTPGAFLGPGYFGVAAGRELVFDYDLLPSPEIVPEGWPKVRSNSEGIAAMVFGGMQFHLRGSGKGLLTGSIWRNRRDQGAFVNLVRARLALEGDEGR